MTIDKTPPVNWQPGPSGGTEITAQRLREAQTGILERVDEALLSVVRTVDGVEPDEDGNVDVAGGGGSGGSALPTFEQAGDLEVVAGRMPFPIPSAQRLTRVYAVVSTPPVGAAVRVDVNRNGTTIFSDQTQRPTIPDGSYRSAIKTVDLALAAGDVLTADIDQVGSTQPGANLTIVLQLGVPTPPPPAAPTITSPASADADQGAAFSHTVTTTGNPAPALTRTGALPAGVTFVDNNDGTATIAGTPTASGSFQITITATNATSPPASQTFTLDVAAPFSYASLPSYAQEWDVSTVTASADAPVGSLPSLASGGVPLTQSTASARPLFKPTGQNGRPILHFDGTNDNLMAAFSLPSAFTIYLVELGTGDQLFDAYNQTSFQLVKANGATPRVYLQGAGGTFADVNPSPTLDVLRVFTICATGTAVSLSVDLQDPVTDTDATPTGLGGVAIGQAGFAAKPIDFAHLLVYNAAHSPSDRTTVITNLMSKWGIS